MCFLKNSAVVLNVTAVTLFIMAKENATFTSEQLNIWEFGIQSAVSDHLLTFDCNINFNSLQKHYMTPIIFIYLSRKAY